MRHQVLEQIRRWDHKSWPWSLCRTSGWTFLGSGNSRIASQRCRSVWTTFI